MYAYPIRFGHNIWIPQANMAVDPSSSCNERNIFKNV
jgi:hypothetical protein